MTTKDVLALALEALEQAEESLGSFVSDHGWSQIDMDNLDTVTAAITAIKQAQQAQEPVTGFGKIVGTHGKVVEWPEFTEQAEPDRGGITYYKNNSCKAPNADSPDCICWTPTPPEAK